MRDHEVRVQRPGERFPRERELAWRLGELAPDELGGLTVAASRLAGATADRRGIF
jgi:hypothetical protein